MTTHLTERHPNRNSLPNFALPGPLKEIFSSISHIGNNPFFGALKDLTLARSNAQL